MEVKEDVEQALQYIARKTYFVLDKNHIPRNSHRWTDYEFGKSVLRINGLYDYYSLKMLADWVGV